MSYATLACRAPSRTLLSNISILCTHSDHVLTNVAADRLFQMLCRFSPMMRPFSGLAGARALLVIAHPDDECMFFTPTIDQLKRSGCKVFVLCLSNGATSPVWSRLQLYHENQKVLCAHEAVSVALTGDQAGLGHVRAQELLSACGTLDVSNS